MYKNPGHTVIIIIENDLNLGDKFKYLKSDKISNEDRLVLIRRNIEPHKGSIMFPGGFVEYGETVEHAALRESMEEAGASIELIDVLGVYSDPKRDPRGHNISTVFVAKMTNDKLKAGDDADEVYLLKPEEIDVSKLGFDHPQIFKHYLLWKKQKGTYWSGK